MPSLEMKYKAIGILLVVYCISTLDIIKFYLYFKKIIMNYVFEPEINYLILRTIKVMY